MARAKGFWDMPPRQVMLHNLKLLLIASEVIEAHNVLRDRYDDPDAQTNDFMEELADIIIRTFDLAAQFGDDIGQVIVDKMNKNAGRPMRHNRAF